jgi:NADH:ubiquinone reductase (H+-translocating)
VAAGAQQSYFGHDEFAVEAPGLKTIDDALDVRGWIFGAFELAELEPDPERRRMLTTFVIVGAGATGVEIVGQIAELSRKSLRSNFRRVDPADSRILLLDGASRVLGGFDQSLGDAVTDHLRGLGVEIQFGAMVVGVDQEGLDVLTSDGDLRVVGRDVGIFAAPAVCANETADRHRLAGC